MNFVSDFVLPRARFERVAMCTEAQDFDLRCRGAYQLADQLAESWRAGPDLKFAWATEDVVRLYNEYLPQVIAAYEAYCKTGEYPGDLTLALNLYHLREFAQHGAKLIEISGKEPANKLGVEGVEKLRGLVAAASEIVSEEDYATDMSLENFSEN